jgi:S-DNA-T family DNA segregation ATPase FtsK/SpoIIIE
MIVLNSGDQIPEAAAAQLGRAVWRYRSELTPLALVALVVLTALAMHHTDHRSWPWLAIISLAATAGFAIPLPTWIRRTWSLLGRPAERAYAATVCVSAGGWLTAAVALGPATPPLPVVAVILTVVNAVPWWASGRRRAKVRVERKLESWPEVAKAVGLIGSQVMSALVDVWGWRARLRLARGQTIEDVIAKVPEIESGLGTFRGAVRVYPTPDDLANRCELRVLDTDPHADAIPWPGPSVASIEESVDLGPFEDAAPCRVLFLRRHALLGGATGAGKSGCLNVLMGNLTACRDVVIWAIDLKKGMELEPWMSCIDRLATTPGEARALLADAVAVLEARAAMLAAQGQRIWEPSAEMPAFVIIVDEYAELADDAPDAVRHADSIARRGRAVAVNLIAATQRPTQKAMGRGAVRSQMDVRICFRVRERKDVDLILGQGMLTAGWHAHTLNAPGKFLVSAAEHTTPRRARAYLITDEAVAITAARHSTLRSPLDTVSRDSIRRMPESSPAAATLDDERANGAPEEMLWAALSLAPDEGIMVPDLVQYTGMSRPWVYLRLRDLLTADQVVQVSRGRWRAVSSDAQ